MGIAAFTTPHEKVGVLERGVAPIAGENVLISGRGMVLTTDWASVADPLMVPLVTLKV